MHPLGTLSGRKHGRSLSLILAAVLGAAGPAHAQAEIECRVGGGTVKATPEMCAKLGGAGPAAAAPQASEQSAAQLYATWEQHRRSDHAKAHAAAKEYVGRFPAEAEAEKLRAWIAAYERARDTISAGASASTTSVENHEALIKTLRALLLPDPMKALAQQHPQLYRTSVYWRYEVDFVGCTLRERRSDCGPSDKGQIPQTITPIDQLNLKNAKVQPEKAHVVVDIEADVGAPVVKYERYRNDGSCDAPKLGQLMGSHTRASQRFSFPDMDSAHRFTRALEQFAKVCHAGGGQAAGSAASR